MSPRGEGALYVYGFTVADVRSPISEAGVGGEADVGRLPLGEIAAVVSPLEVGELLGPEGEGARVDLDWVAPRAIRHARVVEEVMQTAPILPLTFGVVFSSEAALHEAVDDRLDKIAAFLDYTADKHEWSVKGFADMRKIREALLRSPAFKERELPEAPGARYFHEKRLSLELDRRIGPTSHELAAEVQRELASLAVDMRPLRLLAKEVSGRSEEMVLNAAFLARVDQEDDFLERVRQLAEAYLPRGLLIEVSGPWPPYSFSPQLEVEPPEAEP